MRALFFSALPGASVSLASVAVSANEVAFTLERAGDGFQIISLTPAR